MPLKWKKNENISFSSMKYEFQITFGFESGQIKLKFTISLEIHKTYYICSNSQLSGFNKNSCPKPKYT
jgi:hypothetical protein